MTSSMLVIVSSTLYPRWPVPNSSNRIIAAPMLAELTNIFTPCRPVPLLTPLLLDFDRA